jgi:hypothetical protein
MADLIGRMMAPGYSALGRRRIPMTGLRRVAITAPNVR